MHSWWKKHAEYEGYNSSYDYTVYDIGFVFECDEELEEESTYHANIDITPNGTGGNYH